MYNKDERTADERLCFHLSDRRVSMTSQVHKQGFKSRANMHS